jgi:hypothetical protein
VYTCTPRTKNFLHLSGTDQEKKREGDRKKGISFKSCVLPERRAFIGRTPRHAKEVTSLDPAGAGLECKCANKMDLRSSSSLTVMQTPKIRRFSALFVVT